MSRILIFVGLISVLLGCEVRESRSPLTDYGELIVEPSELKIDRREKSQEDREPPAAIVTLKNSGTETIELLAVETSCTCTVAALPTNRRLQPGESAALDVTFHIPDVGSRDGWLKITSTASKTPSVVVPVHLRGAELHPPYFLYEPKDIELVGKNAGEPIQTTWTIAAYERRSEPSWVLGVDPLLHDKIQISLQNEPNEILIVDDVVERKYTFLVSATTPLKSEEPYRTYVTFRLSQPSPKQIGHAAIAAITVKIRPAIRLAPDTFHVDLSADQEFPIERRLVLVCEDGGIQSIKIQDRDQSWFQLQDVEIENLNERTIIPLRITVGKKFLETMKNKNEPEFDADLGLLIETSEKQIEAPLRFHFRRK